MAAGAPVRAARAAPPDLYEQGRAGTAGGGGDEREETGTRWAWGEAERKGARPWSVMPGAELAQLGDPPPASLGEKQLVPAAKGG